MDCKTVLCMLASEWCQWQESGENVSWSPHSCCEQGLHGTRTQEQVDWQLGPRDHQIPGIENPDPSPSNSAQGHGVPPLSLSLALLVRRDYPLDYCGMFWDNKALLHPRRCTMEFGNFVAWFTIYWGFGRKQLVVSKVLTMGDHKECSLQCCNSLRALWEMVANLLPALEPHQACLPGLSQLCQPTRPVSQGFSQLCHPTRHASKGSHSSGSTWHELSCS